MLCDLSALRRALVKLDAKVDRLIATVEKVRFMVSRPRLLRIVCLEECNMAITFGVVLPAPPESADAWAEILKGELTVRIPGLDAIVVETSKDQQLTEERLVTDERFEAAQGTVVDAEFVYIDNAEPVGNRSTAVTASIELVDNIPPVAPGELGLVTLDEVPDETVQ